VLTVAVYDGLLNHAYDHLEDVMAFRVVDDKGRLGMVELDGDWRQSVNGAAPDRGSDAG